MTKRLFDTIVLIGSIGSAVGGIFSALQFFGTKSVKKSRKIVWRVFQLGSFRASVFSYRDSERA